MKRLLLAAAAGFSTASAPAAAQEYLHLSIGWLEVTSGTNTPVPNPNRILEPGESARLSISVLIDPPIGSPVTYTPPPPPGIGTLAGLGAIFVDLLAGTGPSPSGAGSWAFIAQAPGWALGSPGTPTYAGAYMLGIQAGQFIPPSGTANSSNPIPDIWHGVWTPSVYSDRAEVWNLSPALPGPSQLAILVRYGTDPSGNPQYVVKFVPGTYGSTTIPIIPAPSAFLVLAPLLARRRRRGALP